VKALFLGYGEGETRLIGDVREKGWSVDWASSERKDLSKWDLIISYGYRHIISKHVIATAKRPIINLHIAYLPYNRGAHPSFWAFYDRTPSGGDYS